jgi:hypothetical protein
MRTHALSSVSGTTVMVEEGDGLPLDAETAAALEKERQRAAEAEAAIILVKALDPKAFTDKVAERKAVAAALVVANADAGPIEAVK